MNPLLAYLLATNQLEQPTDMTLNELIADMQLKLNAHMSTRTEAAQAVQAVIDELQRILDGIK